MAEAIRVLYVDDEPASGDGVGTVLERQDDRLRVETVESVAACLDRLETGRVDCLVSDYAMPDTDGLALLETVRREHGEVPVILFTGTGSEEIASAAISAGVTEYVQKSTGGDEFELLADRIATVVERREAERTYREIFENIPDGVVVHDPQDGSFTDMNAQYAALYDYEKAELMDAGFAAVLPAAGPYSIDNALDRVEAAIAEGPQTFEWQGVRKGGEQIWTEVHLTPITLHGNDRILAVVRDITERKRQADQLQEEHAFTEVALERVVDFYWVLDTDGIVVDWSDSDGAVTGYTREEAVGTHATEFFPPDQRADIEQGLADLREQGTVSVQVSFQRDDGTTVPYQFDGTVLTDEEGTVDRMCGFGQDISERVERERELERQNQRLEEFASTVSHDLRSPLSVAQGHLELAREESDSEHLEAIDRALDRSQALIDDLMTLARGNGEDPALERLDLAGLVTDAWERVGSETGTLTLESVPAIRADQTRCRQLVENLLRNAVDHAGPRVTVTVGAHADGFFVADDGEGIPESERAAVFEPGYSTRQEGTGFGLRIVDQVATAHGWTVTVTEAETGGARFEISGVEMADDHG